MSASAVSDACRSSTGDVSKTTRPLISPVSSASYLAAPWRMAMPRTRSSAIFALNSAWACASMFAANAYATVSCGGEHSRLAFASARADAWQSADASHSAEALGGVTLPSQPPLHSASQLPRHEASPVHCALPCSTRHLPEQVPLHSAATVSSQVPVQSPVHSPAQLPSASRTLHSPSHSPRQVPPHSPPASRLHA